MKEKNIEKHSDKCKYKPFIGRTDLETVPTCDCDGYHTFDELYKHRIVLFIALCHLIHKYEDDDCTRVWRSQKHSDGTNFDRWFVLGINEEKGEQITYHLPNEYWDKTFMFKTLEKAPEFDGHTSDDVIDRIIQI